MRSELLPLFELLLACPLNSSALPLTPPSPFSLPAVSIYATGQVLHQTHDWSLVFEVAAGLYLFGALVYLSNASCEEQFADAEAAPAPAPASSAKPKAQ